MPGEAVLTGQLGLLSLFDLGQLLMLNGATGEMSVTCDGRRGYLYFVRGQIVNAVDEEYHEGEGAAYRLFAWKTGTFEFKPTSPTDSRAITESTEGLMMEAARRMDESGTGETTGVADRLARRTSNLEVLRLAFDSVMSQARPGADGSEPDDSPMALLQTSTDALLFRPNDLPRARLAGRWRAAGTHAIESGAFDQLRTRLLEGARPGAAEAGVNTWVVKHDDGRLYEVTHLSGEFKALWVRAAGLAPLTPALLDGPHEALQHALSAAAGLLLVSAPDAESADRLLHACVAHILRERAGTVLLAADSGRWRHADEAGALLRASGAEAAPALRALVPEVAAFDHAHATASAEALQVAARVVVAVVSPDPESALSRWCARVGRRWGDGIEALVAGVPVEIVHADGETGADGRVPFGVAHVSTAQGPASLSAAAPDAPRSSLPAPAPQAEAAPRTGHEKPAKSPAPKPGDAMAALAAELKRSLRKAA